MRSRATSWVTALGSICVVLVLEGCSSQGNREFVASVGPVLSEAATLPSRIAMNVPNFTGRQSPKFMRQLERDVDSDGDRALGEVRSFRSSVNRLPQPRRRELRFLRACLEKLGVDGELLVESGVTARRSTLPSAIHGQTVMGYHRVMSWAGKREGVYAAHFSDALLTAAAAERVALGSSTIREQGQWFDPLWKHLQVGNRSTPTWPDSMLQARERRVRAEIAALDGPKP